MTRSYTQPYRRYRGEGGEGEGRKSSGITLESLRADLKTFEGYLEKIDRFGSELSTDDPRIEALTRLRTLTINFLMQASERLDEFLKVQLLLAQETLSDVEDLE